MLLEEIKITKGLCPIKINNKSLTLYIGKSKPSYIYRIHNLVQSSVFKDNVDSIERVIKAGQEYDFKTLKQLHKELNDKGLLLSSMLVMRTKTHQNVQIRIGGVPIYSFTPKERNSEENKQLLETLRSIGYTQCKQTKADSIVYKPQFLLSVRTPEYITELDNTFYVLGSGYNVKKYISETIKTICNDKFNHYTKKELRGLHTFSDTILTVSTQEDLRTAYTDLLQNCVEKSNQIHKNFGELLVALYLCIYNPNVEILVPSSGTYPLADIVYKDKNNNYINIAVKDKYLGAPSSMIPVISSTIHFKKNTPKFIRLYKDLITYINTSNYRYSKMPEYLKMYMKEMLNFEKGISTYVKEEIGTYRRNLTAQTRNLDSTSYGIFCLCKDKHFFKWFFNDYIVPNLDISKTESMLQIYKTTPNGDITHHQLKVDELRPVSPKKPGEFCTIKITKRS